MLAASEDVILDCGAGVRLLGHYAALPTRARGLVVLIHGWEGSAASHYMLSTAQHLYERGFEVFRLNLRDHGPSHHLNEELFHSCRIDEVVGAVREVGRRFAREPLSVVGYSLGGNFALRVAVRAPGAGIDLRQVVAVCPVLDPVRTLAQLEQGLWIYRRYFVRKWRASLQKKRAAFPSRYQFGGMLQETGLTRLTEDLVVRYTEFPDLMTYLRGYGIVGEALAGLAVPARIIAAQDDPIIPAADLDRLALVGPLTISRVPHGGHCGFLESLSGPSWADQEIYATLTASPSA
jgi:predicted alpha/beta-fold hydrolase